VANAQAHAQLSDRRIALLELLLEARDLVREQRDRRLRNSAAQL
jgi:hypothetical protein